MLDLDGFQRSSARRYHGEASTLESGQWSDGSESIVLVYSFITSDSIYTVAEDENLEGYIERWYNDGVLALGAYGDFGDKTKLYEFQYFEFNSTPCVMFRNTWGGGGGIDLVTSRTKTFNPLDLRGLGRNQVVGSACNPALKRYSREEVQAILSASSVVTPGGLHYLFGKRTTGDYRACETTCTCLVGRVECD